jgi:hypothetical protein
MQKKKLEEHLADFIMANPGPNFLDYRRRCLAHWEVVYGLPIVNRVKNVIEKKWRGKHETKAGNSQAPQGGPQDLGPGGIHPLGGDVAVLEDRGTEEGREPDQVEPGDDSN